MRKAFLLFLVYCIIALPIPAQEREQKLDSLFSVLHERGQFNGNALVVMGGQKMHLGYYGLADRESDRKLTETSIFNLGNAGMIFTATAILQLEEQGKLKIDDPASRYFPVLDYTKITIRQLLNHSSGLDPLQSFLPELKPTEIADNRSLIMKLVEKKPDPHFKPGQKFEFNELNYIILAEIVEAVSGMPFGSYLEKNVFLPAEMTNTALLNINESLIHKNIALGYMYDCKENIYIHSPDSPTNSYLYNSSGFTGNGNIYSSVRDIYKFCQAVRENKILNRFSISQMTESSLKTSQGNFQGLGWTIMNDHGDILLYEEGNLPGYSSHILWNYTENHVIVLLSNEYLENMSYNGQILNAVSTFVNQDKFFIPKLDAAIEIFSLVNLYNKQDLKEIVKGMKKDSLNYRFEQNSLNRLIQSLEEDGEEGKAKVISKILED